MRRHYDKIGTLRCYRDIPSNSSSVCRSPYLSSSFFRPSVSASAFLARATRQDDEDRVIQKKVASNILSYWLFILEWRRV